MIVSIAGRELRSLFMSPIAWLTLAIAQFILAYLFLSHLDNYLAYQGQLAASEESLGVTAGVVAVLFRNGPVVLLFIVPLLTMGLVSQERRNQTLPLLLSAPLSMTTLVLGKYVGTITFFMVILLLVGLMALALFTVADLDIGRIMAGWLALTLLVAAFTAIGLFTSTLTATPTLAAVTSFGLSLLLWGIDGVGDQLGWIGDLLRYLSLARHYEALLQGLFDSADLAYYLLFIGTFLTLAVGQLEAYRLRRR